MLITCKMPTNLPVFFCLTTSPRFTQSHMLSHSTGCRHWNFHLSHSHSTDNLYMCVLLFWLVSDCTFCQLVLNGSHLNATLYVLFYICFFFYLHSFCHGLVAGEWKRLAQYWTRETFLVVLANQLISVYWCNARAILQ